MGEQSIPPQDNDLPDQQQNGNVEIPPGEQNDNFEEDMAPEEFEKLDSQLDALNSALDDIEQKNDDIHAQLVQLLHANREIRQQLQASKVADSEPQL